MQSYAATPEAIAAYGPLHDAAGTRTFALEVVRVTAKGVIARIEGVADRTAAEGLRGTELYLPRERLPEAGADEFYHADLIGLTAVSPEGASIGRVVAVANFGAGDLVEIRLEGSSATEFIPFTAAFVPVVDIMSGRVVVCMPAAAADDDESGEDGKPTA